MFTPTHLNNLSWALQLGCKGEGAKSEGAHTADGDDAALVNTIPTNLFPPRRLGV